MSRVPGFSVKSDRHGYEFVFDGELCVAVVDSGYDGADFENFVRDLPDLDKEYPGWSVSVPDKYRGQNSRYVDGARFLTVRLPDGRETTLEFTYRRLPWRLTRGLESRYGQEGLEQGKLSVASGSPQGKKRRQPRKAAGQRKGKGRTRRNPKVA